MKTIALIMMLGLSGAAAAGYKEAAGELKDMEPPKLSEVSKELDGLLLQPGATLDKDARAAEFLAQNQAAMELFRQAAEEPSDGYLLAPKQEKLNSQTPMPKFAAHIKLIKLLLIDAKIKAARRQNGLAEKDLLAAAGFLVQLSEQKSGVILTAIVEQLCLMKAYPLMAESLRNPSAGSAYLKELAARLEKAAKNLDFMQAAMLEEAGRAKGSMRDGVNPDTMAVERAKMSFLQRQGAKKLQDDAFFSKIYTDYDAAVDAHFKIVAGAFRANDPAPVAVFADKRRQDIMARKEAREKRGTLDGIMDGLKGGPEAKKEMADMLVDRMLLGMPSYEKLMPRYHLFFCELNVLRTALAVKLYQRAKRRLPDSLGQLVPAFLEAAPQDSFNKFAPPVYVRSGKKFLLYSFGPDGKDGKGAAALDYEAYFEKPAQDAGDIVFSD